jgi:hypothetical protein
MSKPVRKLLVLVALVSGLALLPNVQPVAEAQSCPSGTFSCTCNGDWVGCVTSVQYCWNACQPSET